MLYLFLCFLIIPFINCEVDYIGQTFFSEKIYFIFAIRFQVRSLHPNNKLADSIVYRHVHHLLLES